MQSSTLNTPHVVYHVAAMGNWKEVVSEQLCLLKNTGLADALAKIGDTVRVSFVGEPSGLEYFRGEAAINGVPVTVVRSDSNTSHYETFAIFEAERLAKEEKTERHILYFHTKGVSEPWNTQKSEWRAVMNHHVVELWRENVETLSTDEYDAVGWNWFTSGNQHFSGNFWMARADWIRRLPAYADFHNWHDRVRFSCELWIGSCSSPQCRAYSKGTVNSVSWNGGYDYQQFLPKIPTKITWMAASNGKYSSDLAALSNSFWKLGQGHTLLTCHLSDTDSWKHRRKLSLQLKMLNAVETSHVFWIDADCEFRGRIHPSDLIDADKPLSCVNHFAFDHPLQVLPQHLHHRIPAGSTGYWQACMWGGEVGAVRDAVEWSYNENVDYDEHILNVYFQEHRHLIKTLPCMYAAPTSFRKLEQCEDGYRRKAGGSARISHHNREISRS